LELGSIIFFRLLFYDFSFKKQISRGLEDFLCLKRRKGKWYFRIFAGRIDGSIMAARLQKIISKDEDYKMESLRLPPSALTIALTKAAVEVLLETHFPGCQHAENTAANQPHPHL
jgi:hypothetical protein